MIEFKKINEAQLKVVSDDLGAIMELGEHFTYYAEGYKFMPAFKNKMWDGKIRIFNRQTQVIAKGLLLECLKFCKDRGYKFKIDPAIMQFQEPSREDIELYMAALPITDAKGNPIQPRDYQMDAIVKCIQNRNVLIESPTGSGKSLIIYCVLRYFHDMTDEGESMKSIIVVPTTSLVEQMASDFADYSSKDDEFDGPNSVHKIYSGKDKETACPIIVTTWQSIYKLGRPWFQKFGMVIGDEAHQFKAKSLNGIMEKMVNAPYRIGTTGTVGALKLNELTLIGNFGPKYKTISTKELMDKNTLSKLKIKCIVLDHDKQLKKVVSKMKYQDEIAMIVSHENRNKFIRELVTGLKGNTLVLFNRVESHGVPLYEMIKKKHDNTHFVSGKVATEDRERIRAEVDSHEGEVVLYFGDKKVVYKESEPVKLVDGTTKLARDITTDDDVYTA